MNGYEWLNMMGLPEWIGAIAFALLFYTYFGYFCFLLLWSLFFKRPITKDESLLPSISVILPIYNEEKFIGDKIENLFELDYPAEKMEIIIGSDSNDGTNQILREMAKKYDFQFYTSGERRGKIGAINDLVPMAKNEILVFTDAHEIFEKDSLKKLVRNFADPKVGAVTGKHAFLDKEGGVSEGTSLYWRYERWIHSLESDIWSLQSADGTIYAMRKDLFLPPSPRMMLDDDLIPLQVALQGYRVVYEREALAYSAPFVTVQAELSRRIVFQAGHFQNFLHHWTAFIPFYSPIAFSYFSHKFLRTLTGFLMVTLALASPFFSPTLPFQILQGGQMAFYTLALLGLALQKMGKSFFLFSLPLFLCIHGYASIAGFFKFFTLSRKRYGGWEKKDPGT